MYYTAPLAHYYSTFAKVRKTDPGTVLEVFIGPTYGKNLSRVEGSLTRLPSNPGRASYMTEKQKACSVRRMIT